MTPNLQYAMQLLSQSRYDLAETALRRALSENPDDATAHALLALCCAGREEFDKAMQEVEVAIGLAPAHPLVFYVQSCVLTGRNCFREAEAAIRQAIELDPDCSEHWAQLARVHLEQRQWAAALAAAEQGLTLDPEDDTCLNLRALSLARLGRRVEAGETIQAALRRNPEDALTHANMGWSLLERAQPQQALEHFREALRLDAENEWARQGVVEAMKARHFLYRIVLGWFLWMLRLPGRAQWGILLGAFVGYQLLRNLATSHPQLAPFVTPLLIAYVTFALMTWLAAPLLNLTLRLNRFGRLALTREQIVTSNWVGLCVLGALLSFGWYVFYGGGVWLVCAVSCALIIPPLSHIYSCHAGWPRVAMVVMTMALGSLGCLVAVTELLAPWVSLMLAPAVRAVGGLASNVFLFGAILAQFAVNALVHVRPRQGGITPRQAWQMGIGALLLAASLFAVVAGVQVLHVSSRTKLPIVFRHPIRTRLVKDDDVRLQQLSWPVQERESAALVDRGFTVLGSCTLEGVPDLHLWVLYHEAQSCVADFLEESPNRLVCRIMTRYQDGRLVTYSNGPEAEGLEPPQCTTESRPRSRA